MAGYVGGGGLGDFAIVYGSRAFEWEVTVVATRILLAESQLPKMIWPVRDSPVKEMSGTSGCLTSGPAF